MTTQELKTHLEIEAAKFDRLAANHAIRSLHKSSDGKSISDFDARLIRDHEIRSEILKTIAAFLP